MEKACDEGSDTCSNDAPPPPAARRLDVVDNSNNKSNFYRGGVAPFLPNRRATSLNEERLAVILSMGKPTKEESKLELPVKRKATPAGTGRGTAVAKSLIQVALQRKGQPINEQVLQGLRENMREELLKRLSKSNLAGSAKQSPEMQAAFAKRLEELLYKTSKSVETYADSKTLDRRLQALMAAMQRKKARTAAPSMATAAGIQRKQQQQTPSTRSSSPSAGGRKAQEQRKRQVLLQALGQAKTTRVFKVIAEIKLIQLGREVTQGKPYAPIPMCTKLGCSFSVPCEGDQKAPQVVRDLFFNTAIVAAFEKTPADRLQSLPWDQLLAQGEARLSGYHEWYRQRQAAKKTPEGFRPI